MEKTIEIPEGYEARIEGNKVILEPKESEDEKMIRIIEDAICTNEAQQLVKTKYGLELTNLADWLEKQGSQNLANSAKTCKNEQNPAWSEEDDECAKIVTALVNNRGDRTKAASELNMSVRTLYRKIKEYELDTKYGL